MITCEMPSHQTLIDVKNVMTLCALKEVMVPPDNNHKVVYLILVQKTILMLVAQEAPFEV